MLSSVVEETRRFLRFLVEHARCGQRKSKLSPPAKSRSNPARKSQVFTPKGHYDSDVASKSTDAGDLSSSDYPEFSDYSCHFDGSDTDSAFPTLQPRLPTGLCAPPGLEYFGNATGSMPGSNFNGNAPIFCPGMPAWTSMPRASPSQGPELHCPQNAQSLRQTMRMLKGALEDWEAHLSMPQYEPATRELAPAPASIAPNGSLLALREALSRLSPKDASTMRDLLDSKVASAQNENSNSTQVPSPPEMLSAAAFNRNRPYAAPELSTGVLPSTPLNARVKAPSPWSPPFDSCPMQKPLPRRHLLRKGLRGAVPQTMQVDGAQDDSENSLADTLKELTVIDNARVLMVRQVNRLGLNSAAALQEHFTKFGHVDKIMVSHTRSKSKCGKPMRLRPACLGFVVMADVAGVEAALARGPEHVVKSEQDSVGAPGEMICVFRFQSHDINETKKK